MLFNERCSGCHSLDAANAYGSKPEGQIQGGERTNGPNSTTRKESRDDVLFAIRNGGFSGAIMPANIVVGEEAEAVADFLSEYSGGGGGGDPALLDLRLIRADPQPARDALARRGVDRSDPRPGTRARRAAQGASPGAGGAAPA